VWLFLNSLHITKTFVTLRFLADTQLPVFIGNTIRGAFGRALSRLCCELPVTRCDICSGTQECAYGSIFKAQSEESTTNPFVISAPYPSKGKYFAGDTISFCITVFGRACDFEEDVISAVKSLCTGKLQNAMVINTKEVYSREWSDRGAETIAPCDLLTIRFITPVEMRSEGKPLTEITFEALIDSLFGRIAGIIDNYTDNKFVLPYHLIARKPFVQADYRLRRKRFSTGSQPVDGLIGTVCYFGDLTEYLSYIDLGTQLHIGKKTTRGCGEYDFTLDDHF